LGIGFARPTLGFGFLGAFAFAFGFVAPVGGGAFAGVVPAGAGAPAVAGGTA
jgi:hypothetical protein